MRAVLGVLSIIWRENVGSDRILFLFRALAWQARKRFGNSFVATLHNGTKIKVYPASAFSGIFYSRWIEAKDLLFIRAHADLASTFVDVGANVGLFSALLFDKFRQFHLIEPAVSSFRVLRETCELNPGVKCVLWNVAIADQRGELTFADEGEFATTSRIVDGRESPGMRLCRVSVETLDHIMQDVGKFVLKVDVEGLEERVFLGARQLFRSAVIKLVLFERLGRTNIDNIIKFLKDVDYVLFIVTEDGAVSQNEDMLRRPLINLFACPRDIFRVIAG